MANVLLLVDFLSGRGMTCKPQRSLLVIVSHCACKTVLSPITEAADVHFGVAKMHPFPFLGGFLPFLLEPVQC